MLAKHRIHEALIDKKNINNSYQSIKKKITVKNHDRDVNRPSKRTTNKQLKEASVVIRNREV